MAARHRFSGERKTVICECIFSGSKLPDARQPTFSKRFTTWSGFIAAKAIHYVPPGQMSTKSVSKQKQLWLFSITYNWTLSTPCVTVYNHSNLLRFLIARFTKFCRCRARRPKHGLIFCRRLVSLELWSDVPTNINAIVGHDCLYESRS